MAITFVLLLSTTFFVSLKGARVLITLFAVDLGAGPLATGFLFAAHGVFPLMLAVYAGRIADRIDSRILMYCGIAGFATCMLLPFFFPVLPTLYITIALGGLASMLVMVATQNLVGALSTPESRTRNYSFYSLGESLATVVGPVCVGFAIDAFRHPLTYLCLAVYTAALGIVLYLRHDTIPHVTRESQTRTRSPLKDLLKLPALREALLVAGLVMAGLDLFNLYLPVYARSIGLSASAIGMIIGAFGAAGLITRLAIPALAKRWEEHGILTTALVISAFAFVTIPLTTNALLLGAAAFALGLGLGCGQPLTMVLVFNASPRDRTAEGIAMRLAMGYSAHLIIPPVFGAIGSVFGLAPIFWTCAALLSSGAFFSRRSLK